MKVFVAGATGVLGRQLVPKLVARGHEVVGMTRSASRQDLVRSLGAHTVVADALDADAVAQAVASAEPEVIVHELTALSGKMSIREARHPERFEGAIMTGRLRTEATDHLLAAGRAVGAGRFVAQSFGSFRFAGTGGTVQTEDESLAPDPRQAGLDAILYLEQEVTTIEWGAGSRALRRLVRSGDGDQPGSGCGDGRADPQASVPDRRPRVASGGSSTSRTRRRRPPSRSSAASRVSTTSSTTNPRRCGSGCRCWRARWRQATEAHPTLAGAAGGG